MPCAQDTHNVFSATFHPSGNFVLAGTDHHMVRAFAFISVSSAAFCCLSCGGCGQAHLYDAESLQCFTPSVSESHHTGGINQVRCAADGKQYATAGKDGTIRLWDIVTSKCVATLDSGHDKMVSRLALRRSSFAGCTSHRPRPSHLSAAGGHQRRVQQEPEVPAERRAQQHRCAVGPVRAAAAALLLWAPPRAAPLAGVLQRQ